MTHPMTQLSTYISKCSSRHLSIQEHSQGWRGEPHRFRASLEISLGNPASTGAHLRCLCEWSAIHFGSFEVSLGDTLLSHNYTTIGHPKQGVVTMAVALDLARRDGDHWLSLNLPIIQESLPPSVRIVRGDEWRRHSAFEPMIHALRDSLHNDPLFEASVRSDISQYLCRRDVEVSSLSKDAWMRLREYIVEELAVYAIQATERPTVNIYPGKPLKTLLNIKSFRTLPDSLRDREYCYVAIKTS